MDNDAWLARDDQDSNGAWGVCKPVYLEGSRQSLLYLPADKDSPESGEVHVAGVWRPSEARVKASHTYVRTPGKPTGKHPKGLEPEVPFLLVTLHCTGGRACPCCEERLVWFMSPWFFLIKLTYKPEERAVSKCLNHRKKQGNIWRNVRI